MSLNFTNELLPLRSEPKSNLASLFLSRDAEVQMRRTHQSKASQQTERAKEGSSRGGHGLRSETEKASFPPSRDGQTSPLLSMRRFLETEPARPFQNGQRDKAQLGRVRRLLHSRRHSAVHSWVGRLGSRSNSTKMPFYLTKATPSSFPQRRGRETGGRTAQPTRYARSSAPSVAAAIESLIERLTRLTD